MKSLSFELLLDAEDLILAYLLSYDLYISLLVKKVQVPCYRALLAYLVVAIKSTVPYYIIGRLDKKPSHGHKSGAIRKPCHKLICTGLTNQKL